MNGGIQPGIGQANVAEAALLGSDGRIQALGYGDDGGVNGANRPGGRYWRR